MPDYPANYAEINRTLWNTKTVHHVASDFYNVPAFLAGESSLNAIELGLLGEVVGQRVLHLQCHFGQDSLSLSRLGAQVTGVDLSDQAIAKARELNAQLGLNAEFICADVYALPQQLHQQFDMVFTTYGVLGWLPDMDRWAAVVAHSLKPGGRLVLVEFHPVVWMFDNNFTRFDYSYFNRETITELETGTYADRAAPIETTSVSWNHSLSEVLGALLGQGLEIRHFDEYDYSPYNCFAGLEDAGERCYQFPHLRGKLPMVYSVVAQKK
ncbi:class I SAM-dependent methyltransferase [Hymenobacter canadensis]|uniref:Class I SAM-dependent methyltransferase n=1 Tax=Hymenobacter canadensis TaxID=2999067 RepID=A0ABY7LPU3_9BACT|nr:class I SAM-dependent methyltransferase [Hymenobacter canadensis]WBA42433.1 class I SAM-dependent methyltransferase [Hymenobacter canadensis]